jgi:elongation factor P--beta-lysine ligase
VRAVADWWDAVELWLTQLSFVFQVMLALVVVVPLCWGVAVGLDRLVDRVAALVDARVAARRAGRNR